MKRSFVTAKLKDASNAVIRSSRWTMVSLPSRVVVCGCSFVPTRVALLDLKRRSGVNAEKGRMQTACSRTRGRSLHQLHRSCSRSISRLSLQRFPCNWPHPEYKSLLSVCKRLSKFRSVVRRKMRRRFLGLLLTCVMLGTDASKFACPKFDLRRSPAAVTAEDASIVRFSGEVSTSSSSAILESAASAPPHATVTASFATRHENEEADPSPTSQMSKSAEAERSSVAMLGRSEGRSLRQDDGLDDEASTGETDPCCLREHFLDVCALCLGRPSLFAEQTNP